MNKFRKVIAIVVLILTFCLCFLYINDLISYKTVSLFAFFVFSLFFILSMITKKKKNITNHQ